MLEFVVIESLCDGRQILGGASTPEKTSTESGSRAPRISMDETAAFSSATSDGVNAIDTPPIFSSICAICVVPGMGTIQGFCAISQANAICPGMACFRLAQLFTKSTSAKL